MSVEPVGRGCRIALEGLVGGTTESLNIACPFIRAREAAWVAERLQPSATVSVLTNVSAASVADGVLEIEALQTLADRGATVTTRPGLHAKVFIDGSRAAIAPCPTERRRDSITRYGARETFAGAQVGQRSANELFSIAIRLALEPGPRHTTELHSIVQGPLPELCDDSEGLVINGERFGKAWKHRLRNAQQYLKRRAELSYDARARRWSLRPVP